MRVIHGAAIIAAVAGSAIAAPTVSFQRSGGNADNGGAFLATTSDHGTFETFCIERNETVSMGPTYFYEISDRAIGGGVGGHNNQGYDIVSDQTKNIYYEFRRSNLQGLVGGNALNWDANTLRNAVQNAIWHFEDEFSGSVQLTTDGQVLVNWANAQGNLRNGAVNVRAMNVWDNDDGTGARQDMLIIIPLPSVAGMSFAGLLGLAAARRRRA